MLAVSILTSAAMFALVMVTLVMVLRMTGLAPRKGIAGYDLTTGTGVWYAQMRPLGVTPRTPLVRASRWGQLRVYDGTVSYTLDGARAPSWTIPANQLCVPRPPGTARTFDVLLPGTGWATIEPSVTRSARWRSVRSSAGPDYRTTQDVVTILHGWGAR